MTKDFSWLAEQVVYEIFPERFAVGKRYTLREKLALGCYHRAGDYVTRDWSDLPVNPSQGKDFFGGDLNGIIDHLDYLQRIGITTLFLTPIFSAPSNHKYDATDFFRVDEQFGGEQALVELIEQLHNRKMYLFLDISFNHISDIHPWFVAAMRNEQPFRDFFISSSDFSKDEFDDTGIPDFFLREFRFGFTVEKLCEAIEDDNYDLPLSSARVTIDWLNEIIRETTLYEKIVNKKSFDALTKETINYLTELKPYSEKSKGENNLNLRKLNRYLLEAFYPQQTPSSSRDRLSIKKLCKAIENDNYGLSLSPDPDTVDWLNELIRKVDFYDKVVQKKDVNSLDGSTRNAIGTLKTRHEASKSEDDLKKLNRYLLEVFYPRETPMSYQCWHGYRHMPELNLSNKKLQGLLYRDDNSVLQKYLRMGVDGFRFDVAIDLGLDVIRDIRQALTKKFPHVVLIGEVTNYAGNWIETENGYHGVMNYYFHGALFSWLVGKISSLQMNYIANEYSKGYGEKGSVWSWNILSSHDTPRLKSRLRDESARHLALVAQFTLPGVPFIYYGEEIGMDGGADPDCRRPMVWDEARWDKTTFELYQKLIEIRKSRAELREGRYMMLGHKMASDALVFLRYTKNINEVSIVVLNRGSSPLNEKLFIPYSHLYHALRLKDMLSGDLAHDIRIGGNIDLKIPGRSAAILVPDDTKFANYGFYKPRNIGN